ncbi:hypothetical protein [Streptomyces wuyuanensis]|uniref:hypothetical protein n=1 Tax=Streptomyces wuyuanensis TaxID=1196353 RepID=UPI00369F9F62
MRACLALDPLRPDLTGVALGAGRSLRTAGRPLSAVRSLRALRTPGGTLRPRLALGTRGPLDTGDSLEALRTGLTRGALSTLRTLWAGESL